MRFLATLLLCLFAANAEARGHGGVASGAAPTAPILSPTTYTLGQQTQAFFGYVYLHAQDFTSPSYTPLTVSGLGLMSPSGPACDTWYMTYVSGRSSSDFQISASVADASALTPLVTFTGQGNLTGDYVFNIQCSRLGVFSNTVPMTVHTIANAANVGAQDNFSGGGWAPSGFGGTPGAKLLLSTGADFHAELVKLRGVTLGSTNANRLTITIADAGRMPYVSNFTVQGLSNIDVTGISATGNTDVGINDRGDIFGSVFNGTFTSNETWENLNYYGSMLMYPSTGSNGNSEQAFFNTQCNTNCLFQNSKSDFTASGFNIGDGLHASNIDIGHFSDNCMFMNSLFSGATVDNFTTCHDPLVPTGGLHVDCMQVGDGATAYLLTVNNVWCIQAGGMGETQGVWFGGSQLNGFGYIDDGTGAHGPGTVLTLTSGSLNSSSYGAKIWSPGNITIAQDVRVLQSNGSTGIPTMNLAATNIGSPGSPVAISNVGAYSMQAEGIVQVGDTYHGVDSVGESGTSFVKHFGLVQQAPNPYPALSFTGSVNGSITSPYSGATYATGITITATTVPTVSSLSVNPTTFQTGLSYPGCPAPSANAFCSTANTSTGVPAGLSIGGEFWSTEAVQATGTGVFTCCTTVDGVSREILTISGPCTGRWDYNIRDGSKTGGLLVSGAGVPDNLFIYPILGYPADGCAGTYYLEYDPGVSIPGSIAISGRPQQQRGVYGLYNYGTGATPTGSVAMTATQRVGIPANSWAFYQQNCVTNLHQGTFAIQYGYSDGGFPICGAPVTNTTTTGLVTPVAADFATGVLPGVSLSATTAAAWDAMDTGGGSVQKRAYICNKILPAAGHSLDLGGGNWVGPVTSTGEIILAGGNVAVPGCGIH